jgi:glyoxylase-like metal-dependent hydrolase (beta-lactamase superfamily II)
VSRSGAAAALALALVAGGCGDPRPRTLGVTAEGYEVAQIALSWSNVFLICSPHPILVDAGSPGDLPRLEKALSHFGLRPTDLALVVLTHAHADHAGLGAALRRAGARVALGAGDVPMARAGRNGELGPTSFFARLLQHVVPGEYPPFDPDIALTSDLDLSAWGVAGKVVVLPGHTPGSVAVVLANHVAFAGDTALGGMMGGALFPDRPGEHYFQPDPGQNRRNLRALLDLGVSRLYLGHGGPVAAADVARAFSLPMR